MGQINWKRVLLGGVVVWVVYNVLGAAAWFLFLQSEWQATMAALGRAFWESASFYALLFLVVTLVGAICAIWLYAAIRPRYGPGPKTAAKAAVVFWVIGALLPTMAWGTALSLPPRLLVLSLAAILVQMVVATLAGAWLYQE